MFATVVPPSNMVVTNCPPNVTVCCSGGIIFFALIGTPTP